MTVSIDDIRSAAWVNTGSLSEGETLIEGWTCRGHPRLTFARTSRAGRRVCDCFYVDGQPVASLADAAARLSGEEPASILTEIRAAILGGLEEGSRP